MAVMQSRDTRTEIAGVDLSSAQFKFVTLESDAQVDLANSAGEAVYGVCIVGAGAGKAVTIVRTGSVLVEAGDVVAAGAALATDAAGAAVGAGAGDYIVGYAKEAGVDGQIIEIELITGGNIVA